MAFTRIALLFIYVLIFCNYSAVEVPIAVLGAENDHASPPALVKQFEEILSAKPEVGRCLPFRFVYIIS